MNSAQYTAILFAAGILMTGSLAWGQDTPGDDQPLPDIAPREFEITGELEISFPRLQRQPLIGFNPPPQIYEIPRDRRPFIEDYRQAAADLPGTALGAPAAPSPSSLIGGEANRGQLEIGAGRYFARVARAWMNIPVSREWAFQNTLDYEGSNGHRPFSAEPDLYAPFNAFDGDISVSTNQSNFTARLALDGHSSDYLMYGVRTSPQTDATIYDEIPERRGYGLGAALRFATKDNTGLPFEVNVRYGGSRYQTFVFQDETRADSRFNRAEKYLAADSRLEIPFASGRATADGQVQLGGFDANEFVTSDHLGYDAGAGARFLFRDVFNVTLGGRVLGFSTSGVDQTGNQAIYPAPHIEVDVYPTATVHLYARNRPAATFRTQEDIFRVNPFVRDRVAVQPNIATVDAQTGASLYVRPFRLAGHAGYRHFPQYMYFEDMSAPLLGVFETGFFDALYSPARIVHFGGDVTLYFSSVFSASVQARYQSGRLTGASESAIPYLPLLTARTSLSYRFANNRGLFRISGGYEGERFADRDEAQELDPFFHLDLMASYALTSGFGLFLQMDNMSSTQFERWANYPNPTWVTMGGVKLNW